MALLKPETHNRLLLQLHEELLAGLQETQMALAEYKPSNSNGSQPTDPSICYRS